jgi:CheY-like chemotaxis protein
VSSQKKNREQRNVLFVDDEQDFLRLAQETFTPLAGGQWEIHCAASTNAALELLNQRKMDLVVVDVNMPLLDGIQFLDLLGKRHPSLKKVTLTAFATEDKRSACLAAGAQLFIEKPRTDNEFQSVFAMLDDLMNWAPRQGFHGMLKRVGLTDVIQLECLGRNSSVLEVYNEHVFGRIYIENGSIIHAAGGDLTGERALQQLLALPGGSFELVPFEPPPQNTISGPWEFLLMEAARVRDELASQAVPGEPEIDPKTLTAPAVTPARVVEMLICSGQGQALYAENCPDAPGRAAMLKKISEVGARFAETLPLGTLDRAELELSAGRAIALIRPDRLIFVRVAREAAGS